MEPLIKGHKTMNRIKELRKKNNISQLDLAKELNVSQTAVSHWEIGRSDPDHTTSKQLADMFGVSLEYLLGFSDSPAPGNSIPVYARVTAGIPLSAITEIVDYEEIPEALARSGKFFGVRVSGHSMEPNMRDGDVLIVRIQPDVDDGEIAVVFVNGDDAVVKKIKKTPTGVTLVSLNPAYEPMYFTNEEIRSLPLRVVGRVVECRAKY